jgi:hypothetical protein
MIEDRTKRFVGEGVVKKELCEGSKVGKNFVLSVTVFEKDQCFKNCTALNDSLLVWVGCSSIGC